MSTAPFSPTTPSEGPRTGISEWAPSLPEIEEDESFADLVRSLSVYIEDVIHIPHTWEQLRAAPGTQLLAPLINSLSERCHHHNVVSAFLVLKWHYSNLEPDDRGIIETRARVCELVAWRALAHLSEADLIDYLLDELPAPVLHEDDHVSEVSQDDHENYYNRTPTKAPPDEYTGLLSSRSPRFVRHSSNPSEPFGGSGHFSDAKEEDPTLPFVHLNALEIAAVADAKNFLSQRVVQKIVNGIWCGDIVFWDSLNAQTKKKAQKYNKRKPVDPYSRLRVPKYQKIFEAVFFATFLGLYYAVLLERHPEKLSFFEVLLYIWIAAFAYDEFGEFRDAGTLFYAADFWSLWDLAIILIGVAFLIARIVGLVQGDTDKIMNISFDILSLEALFLVPRTCALLSLHPYFGTLIPCLKEMTKDFVKFLGIVLILYVGFLTTFTLLAREEFTFVEMSWILVKVFFGSSYLGFDIATRISPALGPPLMLIFVCMTNILLITSLISLLSNSLTRVMDHAREEYLFQYSVFVLEASASRRLTFYLPPLNLIPLVLFRPLRLCMPAEQLRSVRILLLKVTHFPFVAAIWAYEHARRYLSREDSSWHATSEAQLHKQSLFAGQISSSRKAKQAALTSRSEGSLVRTANHADARPDTSGADDVSDLKQMIWKLSAQVNELSARLEQERR